MPPLSVLPPPSNFWLAIFATSSKPLATATPAAINGAEGLAIEIGFAAVLAKIALAPLNVSIVASAILAAFCTLKALFAAFSFFFPNNSATPEINPKVFVVVSSLKFYKSFAISFFIVSSYCKLPIQAILYYIQSQESNSAIPGTNTR